MGTPPFHGLTDEFAGCVGFNFFRNSVSKFIRVLKKLHTGVKVHFEVNGVQKVINSTIGGKQGDLLFPDLFNLHICAIMQIWRQRRVGADVGLRTKQDFVLGTSTKGNKRASKYGGKYEKGAVFKRNGCETVTVNESIYADDTICAFVNRRDLILNVPILYETFEQCGMEIHIKKPTDKKAKAVAMLAALPPAVYDGLWSEVGGAATYGGTDLSDINVTINDIANCTIPVVNKAKYLGSILDREPGHERQM